MSKLSEIEVLCLKCSRCVLCWEDFNIGVFREKEMKGCRYKVLGMIDAYNKELG